MRLKELWKGIKKEREKNRKKRNEIMNINKDLLFLLEDRDWIRICLVKIKIFSFENNQKWKVFNWNMKT